MMRSTPAAMLALLASAMLLVACGSLSGGTDHSAVIARVNGTAITADQVKMSMPPLPESATDADRKATSKAVLDELIQQEILAQQAKAAKLDREPQVMLAIESARRAVLADQWLKSQVGESPTPNDADVKDFIAHHPEAFSERRQYSFRVAAAQASSGEVAKLAADVAKLSSFEATLQYFRDHQIKYALSDQVRTSDQFPSDVLRKIDVLLEGDKIEFPSSDHIEVAQLVSVKPAPITVQGADPRVANLLKTQAARQRAQSALKTLASSAKIELMGDFRAQQNAAGSGAQGNAAAKIISSDVEKGIARGLN